MGLWAWRGEERHKKVTTHFPEEVRCHNDCEAAMELGMGGLARAVSAEEVAVAGQWKPEDPRGNCEEESRDTTVHPEH